MNKSHISILYKLTNMAFLLSSNIRMSLLLSLPNDTIKTYVGSWYNGMDEEILERYWIDLKKS